jgi:hypothetical protein
VVSRAAARSQSNAGIEYVHFQFRQQLEPDFQSSFDSRERLVLAMTAIHSSTLTTEVPGYADLQREIHHALLAQNPQWILPNGNSPACDGYDARFAELLMQLARGATPGLNQPSSHRSQFEFQYA